MLAGTEEGIVGKFGKNRGSKRNRRVNTEEGIGQDVQGILRVLRSDFPHPANAHRRRTGGVEGAPAQAAARGLRERAAFPRSVHHRRPLSGYQRPGGQRIRAGRRRGVLTCPQHLDPVRALHPSG